MPRTIQVDYDQFQEIVAKNNECIELHKKLAELARNIDFSHKTASARLDGQLDMSHYAAVVERVSMLEWIAKNMEHLFQITVLTSPRDPV